MKGCVNIGTHGKKTGGDKVLAGVTHKLTPRTLRRLIKKFPNDEKVREVLKKELEKFSSSTMA